MSGSHKGLTIEEISKNLNLSRITTTKCLDSLLVSGQANMRKAGPAKLFTLATRLQTDQILSQSTDLILVLDEKYTVHRVSDSFLLAFGISKDQIENQNITTTFIGPDLIDRIRDPVRQGMAGEGTVTNTWVPVQKEWKAFRIRIIPLVFNWGDQGVVVMLEDRTGEIMAQEENALLADLVNSSPAGIFVHDFKGNFLYANKKCLDLLGYSLAEFRKLNHGQLFMPETINHIAGRMKELRKKGEALFELVALRKDGRQIQLEVNTKLARWGDRDVTLCVATDMSERKQAEMALKESERRFAGIIDFLPDGTFAVDSKGTVIAWNHIIEKAIGVKACDIVGKGDHAYAIALYGKQRPVLLDLIFHDDPEARKYYRRLRKVRDTYTAEIERVFPDIGKRILWLKAAPLYDNEGRITGAIESIRDITEWRQSKKNAGKDRADVVSDAGAEQ